LPPVMLTVFAWIVIVPASPVPIDEAVISPPLDIVNDSVSILMFPAFPEEPGFVCDVILLIAKSFEVSNPPSIKIQSA